MAYEFFQGIDAHSDDDGAAKYAASLIEKDQDDGEVSFRLHDLRRLDGSADHITSQIQNEIGACWLAEQHSFDPTEHLGGEIPSTGEVKRTRRPDTT